MLSFLVCDQRWSWRDFEFDFRSSAARERNKANCAFRVAECAMIAIGSGMIGCWVRVVLGGISCQA